MAKSNSQIINENVNMKYHTQIHRFMHGYFAGLKTIINLGILTYKLQENRIHISYERGKIKQNFSIGIADIKGEPSYRLKVYLIQDFILSIYYNREYNTELVSVNKLAILLGIDQASASKQCVDLENKIGMYLVNMIQEADTRKLNIPKNGGIAKLYRHLINDFLLPIS